MGGANQEKMVISEAEWIELFGESDDEEEFLDLMLKVQRDVSLVRMALLQTESGCEKTRRV